MAPEQYLEVRVMLDRSGCECLVGQRDLLVPERPKETSTMQMSGGGGMVDVVKALAGLPDDARGQIVHDRLETSARSSRN